MLRNFLRGILYNLSGFKTPSSWLPHSKLYIKSENSNWVLDTIKEEMLGVCQELSIPVVQEKFGYKLKDQSIFYTSKYEVLENFKRQNNKIAFPYYHGDPSLDNKFKKLVESIEMNHQWIDRIQVSHSQIEQLILNTGIEESKIHKIPISIDINKFDLRGDQEKERIREVLNIPTSEILIGSFQKDGNGWGEGKEPKLIKGPDIFLTIAKALKDKYDNLSVLLTGPARGYMKKGLSELGIPYYHYFLKDYSDISDFYKALDLYLITSREEGGPRAVLESMASGVPLVTTKVGQAIDLVRHNKNAWMAESNNTDELVHWCEHVIDGFNSHEEILYNARKTAEENSYDQQIVLWRQFMNGFVNKNV